MLARWTEILPLFVVRWLAVRHCERLRIKGGPTVVMARPDALFRVDLKPQIHSKGTEAP